VCVGAKRLSSWPWDWVEHGCGKCERVFDVLRGHEWTSLESLVYLDREVEICVSKYEAGMGVWR
jgi:hypothetical protein